MTPPEVALVVPCHYEAARLDAAAFLGFASTHPTLQFVFVDDGSGDATGETLERLRAAAPSAVVLHHAPRRGKGEAVRAGMLAALARRPSLVGSSSPTCRPPSGRSTTSWPCLAGGPRSSSSSARA